MLAGDGYRVVRKAVQKIGGAVERIDYPEVVGIGVDSLRFLGDDSVIRVSLAQFVDDTRLGIAVDFTDIVVLRFYFDLQVG